MKYARRSANYKPYLGSVILILITFIATNLILANIIRKHYYQMLETESVQYATSYAHSMTKATEANKIINELLEDKLLSAGKTLVLHGDLPEQHELDELAALLNLDEIHYYNLDGVIVRSHQGKYLGWTAFPGHPVFDFMESGHTVLVEDIRQDSESDDFYKYAYFKTEHGFFQIGIQAQRVEEFISAFESERLLTEIAQMGSVDTACFVDSNFIVQTSSNPDFVGLALDAQLIDKVSKNAVYTDIGFVNGTEVFQVYVPVTVPDFKTGTLVITQSLAATKHSIRFVTFVSMAVLIVVTGTLLYILYNTYRQRQQMEQLAYYHRLTNLPNRSYLEEVLEDHYIGRKDKQSALLLVSFPSFSTVNHIFGFHFGDRLLQQLAEKLQEAFQQRLFQFSSNRFALLADDYTTKDELIELAVKVSQVAAEPLLAYDLPHLTNVRTGIVEIDEKFTNPNEIFSNASLALTQTSEMHQFAFFDPAMETKLHREDRIERELRKAISGSGSGALYLEYQPQVDLNTNEIVSFEALARMKSPLLGFVSPLEFINIAERKNLIIALGEWVLREACQFLRTLNRLGYGHIRVAVNISVLELLQPEFPHKLEQILAEYELEPGNLELEITESVIIHNFEEINSIFQQLRGLGLRIALDDFGTGYSSFARIEELNIDVIKIDKYFIDRIDLKPQGCLVLNSLISMGHQLDLAIVAEGVETEKQRQHLAQQKCDLMQGWLFSKSLPVPEAIKKLQECEPAAEPS